MNAPPLPPTHTDASVKSLLGPNKRQALLHDRRFIEHAMTIVFLESCAQPKVLRVRRAHRELHPW